MTSWECVYSFLGALWGKGTGPFSRWPRGLPKPELTSCEQRLLLSDGRPSLLPRAKDRASFPLQGQLPPPGASRGRGWRSVPPSAPPARQARFVALLLRLREPWTRSSHDGGCSRRRRTRGARWGRRARGRRGLGANVSLCVSPFPCSPSVCWARRPRRKAWMTAPTSSRRKTAE